METENGDEVRILFSTGEARHFGMYRKSASDRTGRSYRTPARNKSQVQMILLGFRCVISLTKTNFRAIANGFSWAHPELQRLVRCLAIQPQYTIGVPRAVCIVMRQSVHVCTHEKEKCFFGSVANQASDVPAAYSAPPYTNRRTQTRQACFREQPRRLSAFHHIDAITRTFTVAAIALYPLQMHVRTGRPVERGLLS